MSASGAYVVLVGALSLAAAIGAGLAGGAARLVRGPADLLPARPRRGDRGAAATHEDDGRLSGAFYIAAAMMFCTVAAEWCITAWGASFAEEAADVSADTAVALMFGYFGGVLVGRVTGSRLARTLLRAALLAVALGVAAAGFAVLWPASSPAQTVARAGDHRPRAREPVPARAGRLRRARAGPRAAGVQPRRDGRLRRGPARAADDRRAGRRDEHHHRAAGRAR